MYALLMERADSSDALTKPILLASGRIRPEVLDDVLQRNGIDAWLTSPVGEQADAEQALMSYLRG